MKRALAVFLFLLFAAPLWGQEKVKIGFVDIQRAISESKAGKRARKRFQDEVKKVEAHLLKEKQELEQLRSDIDKKGLLLKEQERKNLEKEFQRKLRDYQRNMRDSQQDLRQRESEMTAEIIRELEKVVTEFGKREKYTVILDSLQLLYMDQAVNLTNKVIELYDNSVGKEVTKGK
ncbi:MAG: OmpH family outer membrane protein [Candidatus Binatia bacterium]